MADGLEDVVELGFEGVDKFGERYYDKVHDSVYPKVHRMRHGGHGNDEDKHKHKHGHSASDQQHDDGGTDQASGYSSAPRRRKERPRQMAEQELRDPYGQRDKRNRAPSPADEYEPSRRWESPSAGYGYGNEYQENVPYGYGQEPYQQSNTAWNASGQYQQTLNPYPPYNPAEYGAAGAYANDRHDYSRPDRSAHFLPPSDDYDDYTDSPRKSRRHSRSSSGSSPSPQRRSSQRHRGRDRDRSKNHSSDKALGARVAGAIAGGLLAHKAGNGDVFTSIVGAAVGAFGADAVEKRYEKNKEKGQRKQREWEQKWDKGKSGNEDSESEGDERRQRKYR